MTTKIIGSNMPAENAYGQDAYTGPTSKQSQVPTHPEAHSRKLTHADGGLIARPHGATAMLTPANAVLADAGKRGKPLATAGINQGMARAKFDKAGRDHARSHPTDANNGPAVLAEAEACHADAINDAIKKA